MFKDHADSVFSTHTLYKKVHTKQSIKMSHSPLLKHSATASDTYTPYKS